MAYGTILEEEELLIFIVAFVAAAWYARKGIAASQRFVRTMVTLTFDKFGLMQSYLRPPFPLGVQELLEDPVELYDLLCEEGYVPEDAKLEYVKKLRGVQAEPDKNSSSTGLSFTYKRGDGNTLHSLDVFTKFQSGRGMPMWLQAIRAAAEPGVAREVDFYNKLQPASTLRTAKVLFAGKAVNVNRVCIVLEYLKIGAAGNGAGASKMLRVVPDHKFENVPDMELMLTKVAAMHAKFWGCADTTEESSWLPKRRGVEFAGWALSLNPPKQGASYFAKLFKSIDRYFSKEPLTVVHGDCRPGNMIFEGMPLAKDVIFSDFEAVNIAPGLWDFVYATVLGLTPEARREYGDHLLQAYHSALDRELQSRHKISAPSLEALKDQAQLLTFVLFLVSHTVTTAGYWKNQGNTTMDLRSWGERVLASLTDTDIERVSKLLELKTRDITEVHLMAHNWAEQYELQPGDTKENEKDK